MDSSNLSARLRSLRESHQLTQQELGNYLNISKQGYSHYENGTRTPDPYMLERLASLYDMTLDTLLNPDSQSNPPDKVAETPPMEEVLKGLSRKDQNLLKLFSKLPPEEQEDFIDLLSIKVQQYRIRNNKRKH